MKTNSDDYEKPTPPQRDNGLSESEESFWGWVIIFAILIWFCPFLAMLALPVLGAFIGLIILFVILGYLFRPGPRQ